MDIRVGRNVIGAAVVGLLFSFADRSFSDGYRNPPPTAEGIGKSGVNSVFVDDASAISYNPANLALLDGPSAVLSATLPRTEVTYASPGGTTKSKDEWIVLPNLYLGLPSGKDGLAFGLGIETPFGQGIDWSASDLYNPSSQISIYQAEIQLININPTVALKLSDQLSIGVGGDVYYSTLEFNALTGLDPLAPPSPANVEGDGLGFGGNIGLTWLVSDTQRATLTYRSEVKMDYEGDLKASPGAPFANSSFDLGVTYPNMVSAGYGVELTKQVRVEANVEWIEWSSTKVQIANLGNVSMPMPQNWDDTITYGVGAEWLVDEHWTLRAGYALIESPIPDSTMAPTLPDADRQAISVGLGYALQGHAFDVGYTFSIYDDRDNAASESYEMESDLAGMTYSCSF